MYRAKFDLSICSTGERRLIELTDELLQFFVSIIKIPAFDIKRWSICMEYIL